MSDIDCLLSLILKIMSLNKVLTLLCVQYAVMRKEIKSILTDILLPDYTFVVFLIISCEFSFCMIYYFGPSLNIQSCTYVQGLSWQTVYFIYIAMTNIIMKER